MTPEALRSWRAYQRQLSTLALGTLHRALVNHTDIGGDLIRYALSHGDGMPLDKLAEHVANMAKQAEKEVGVNLFSVIEWAHWWDMTERPLAEILLASEIADELSLRQQRGAAKPCVC